MKIPFQPHIGSSAHVNATNGYCWYSSRIKDDYCHSVVFVQIITHVIELRIGSLHLGHYNGVLCVGGMFVCAIIKSRVNLLKFCTSNGTPRRPPPP